MKKSLLKIALGFVSIAAALTSFGQTYNFTNAAASGASGPTQAQINAAYTGGNTLTGNVSINTQGIQEWTVPASGNYSITGVGACGGEGQGTYFPGKPGTGATISGDFSLTAGTVLKIVVGQKGEYSNNGSGGGGGSFVFTGAPNGAGVLLVAGGGGGHGHGTAGAATGALGGGGSATTAQVNSTAGNGNGASGGVGQGGLAGVGCSASGHGSGGAGWLSNGVNATCGTSTGGSSTTFVGGSSGQPSVGGFGGGGGTDGNGTPGGGGGGYTGGGGGNTWTGTFWGAGAGAGSYNSGMNQVNTAGVSGALSGYTHGSVTITFLCTPTVGITLDAATLPDLTDPCSVAAPTAPTATNSCGTVVGTPSVPFPIDTTTTVTWTFFDGVNTITQTQNVIVNDVTPPTFDLPTLPDSTYWCKALTLDIPTATDNCSGLVYGTTNTVLPITTGGLNVVTWTYVDGNGNSITQTQNITVDVLDTAISQLNPTTITAAPGYVYIWLDCDNGNAIIPGATSQTYTPTASGNYAAVLFFNGCSDTTACFSFWAVGVDESESLDNVSIYPNPTNGLVQINLGNHNGSINYSISTIEGRIITQKTNVTSNNVSVDLSNESKGIYFLKVEDNSSSKVYKIIRK